VDLADLAFAVAGVGALLAGLLPRLLEGRPLSMPVAFLGLGMLVYALPLDLPAPDPLAHAKVAQHLTEVGVIVALMGAGLKLDRPVGWRRWASTWRLLAIAMPGTIAVTALLGWWWAGLVPAAAVLLGSALAPTDPVLASDVQVGEPTRTRTPRTRSVSPSPPKPASTTRLPSRSSMRRSRWQPMAPTRPAGSAAGPPWTSHTSSHRCTAGSRRAGCSAGCSSARRRRACGWPSTPRASSPWPPRSSRTGSPNWPAGTAFLAVFVCAVSIRASERSHEYHQVLHDFTEQIERLLTVLLLLLFGGAVVGGLLSDLTWRAAAVGLALVFAVRPLIAWLALRGAPGTRGEHAVIAFFGIRGIGSFYYLAYATAAVTFRRPASCGRSSGS
jgi:NhaP-type Na+/H+ or K+/H+ antiporter